jgi:uncharacterized protein YraI
MPVGVKLRAAAPWLAATVMVATAPSLALAHPAQVAWTTFLRAGPGETYAVTDEIPGGRVVDVAACSGDWCRIVYGRAEGFVRADLVAAPPSPPPVTGAAGPPSCFRVRQSNDGRGDVVQFCARPGEPAR